ncbi:hypothetical protein [Lactiplantibacillus songbeiensis]|uniref:Uncharacterized protein n=1 Tax=Lactiplantibacillus songbeiensis TaxID=2559920 RepID=A0ABW4BYA4_9LACO|nr:hypothetical protein [Lactiplantibacillus songbeiensis]
MGLVSWLLPLSLVVTISFGIVVAILAVCWWLIFRRTIRTFNTEGKSKPRD